MKTRMPVGHHAILVVALLFGITARAEDAAPGSVPEKPQPAASARSVFEMPLIEAQRTRAGAKPVQDEAAVLPDPKPIRDGIAGITDANTVWRPRDRHLLTFHAQPDGAGAPVLLLYDNRDRDYSRMNLDGFPQIARLVCCEAAHKIGLDSNAQTVFLHNIPTLGNASRAEVREMAGVKNPYWRSFSRQLYQSGLTVESLAEQWCISINQVREDGVEYEVTEGLTHPRPHTPTNPGENSRTATTA